MTNYEHKQNWPRPHRGRWLRFVYLMALAWSVLLAGNGWSQGLRNDFADREIATAPTGQIRQSNASATLELGEPQHGGKPGGHSLWLSWIAPSNGVVRFETEKTSFDTLLAAYFFSSTNDTGLDQLILAASADDSEGFEHESEIKFGVLAGQRYEIAIDGYRGATGPITVEWDFYPSAMPPPIILSSPADRAVNFGDTVTLTVLLTNAANGHYRWYHDADIVSVDSPSLVITNFRSSDVGRYKLRVLLDGPDYFSMPAEIQINTEGVPDALAQDKVLDSLGSALTPAAGPSEGIIRAAATGGVLRGYNGSQIFSTMYALAEPDEPDHCGVNSGASYWFSYLSPTNGTVTLDTIGSRFDTVLAVYTYHAPLTSYAGLIPVACDNDGVARAGASRLEFAAIKGRQYAVVVAGVGTARGAATLNYRLDASRPPVPPTLVQPAAPRTVAAGEAVTLAPQIEGSAPMFFAWRKNGSLIPSATNAVLRINPAAPAHSGNYQIVVSNFVGAPLEVNTPIRVLVAPRLGLNRSADVLTLTLPTVSGQSYQLEKCGTLAGDWLPLGNVVSGNGSVVRLTNSIDAGDFYFRVRVD